MLKEKDFNSIPLLLVNSWEQHVKLYITARTSYKCVWYNSSTFRTLDSRRAPKVCSKTVVNFFGIVLTLIINNRRKKLNEIIMILDYNWFQKICPDNIK